jgi:hypothetical protein
MLFSKIERFTLKNEVRLYVFFSVLIFLYSALRCFYVPIFHDEAATFFHFIQVNSYIPFYAEWDAGNHLLNTALAHFFVNIFDEHMFWLRLPNLLSLLVYLYFTFKITREINNSYVRFITDISILSATFLIEFYSQARGYGMSIAFFAGAIYYAHQYLVNQKLKFQVLLWLLMLLTLLANMSMMNSQLIFCCLVFLFILFKKRNILNWHIIVWLIGGVGLLIISAWYAFIMREKGLLYTGLPDGFVEVTALSFAKYQFGFKSLTLAWILTLIGTFTSLILVWKQLKEKEIYHIGFLLATLLLLNAFGSIFLNWFFKVNFPEERTGVYFLFLWILVFGFSIDLLVNHKKRFQYLALILLYFPVHFFTNLNLHSSLLWYDLHVEKEVYNAAYEFQKQINKPIRISAYRMFGLTWPYQNILLEYPLQLNETLNFPDSTAELVFIRTADFQHNIHLCDTIYYNPKSSYLLISPKNSFYSNDTVLRTIIENKLYDEREYFDIIHWERDSLSQLKEESGILEFLISVNSLGNAINGQIVIAAEDKENKILTYDYIKLQWLKKIWNNNNMSIRRGYHFPKNTHKVSIYYWNIGRKKMSFEISDIIQVKLNLQVP